MGGKTSNESKAKYNDKAYDRINIAVPKGRKAEIQAVAEQQGQSLNGFINGLIDTALESKAATGSPEDTGIPGGGSGIMEPAEAENMRSRSSTLTPTDSQPALSTSAQPQVSIYKRLADLPEEERETAIMGTPAQQEAVKDFAKNMEEKVRKRRGL